MKQKYDTILNREIENILNEVYYNPMKLGESKIKRAFVKTEKRYIDYLEDMGLVNCIGNVDMQGRWAVQLERKGFEVFEKYDGWNNYRKQIIDSASKVEKAKNMAIKYWWVAIVISVLSFLISIFALIR